MTQPIKPFAYTETKAAWATAPKSAWEHVARVANTIAKAIMETFSSLFTVVKNWFHPTAQDSSFVPPSSPSSNNDAEFLTEQDLRDADILSAFNYVELVNYNDPEEI